MTTSCRCKKSQQNINTNISKSEPACSLLTHEKSLQSNPIVKCTLEFVSPALLPRHQGYFYFIPSRSKYLNERKIDDIQLASGYEK